MDITNVLVFLNELVTAGIAILAFSLAVYIFVNNFRSGVAWGFLAVLGSLLVVYMGDLVVPYVTRTTSIQRWLRFQWLGIGLMPAAYLHLSDAVLRSAGYPSIRRRAAVIGSYALSVFLIALAWFSDLLVQPGTYAPPISQMAAGPFFPFFAGYYGLTVVYGTYNVYLARQRALTEAARRRITRLAFAYTVPGLAVFPYLILTPERSRPLVWLVYALTLAGNVLVALALVIMAYTVAYYGVLTYERVIKRNLIRFLLHGPALAAGVVVVALTLMRLDSVLSIPRQVLLVFTITGLIVVAQGVLNVLMPWIDRIVYSQDRQELTWLEELERRLLTSTDLHQVLMNILMALCETMRTNRGFVAVVNEGSWRLQAAYGPVGDALDTFTARNLAEIVHMAQGMPADTSWPFIPHGKYLVAPLRADGHGPIIGLVGIAAHGPLPLSEEEKERVLLLVERAQAAVQDHYLQRQIFTLVSATIPTIVRLQQVHGSPRMDGHVPLTSPAITASEDDFVRWVWDALRHFWGGPKLTENPLLDLQVVAEEAEATGAHRTRALQNVLLQAIERLRPQGHRQMTTSEWLLYNILDLKFVQGKRVREIARRLAMSESDLYRKQRVAVAEVARILKEMEVERVQARQGNGHTQPGTDRSPTLTGER